MVIGQLRLNGTVDIMLPDSTATNLPLERLTRLYDGLEQLEDMWDEEDASDADSSYATQGEEEGFWAMNENGVWEEIQEENGDDWSTDEEAMEIDADGWSSSDPTALHLANGGSPVSVMKVDLQTPEPDDPPSMMQENAARGAEALPSLDTVNEEDKEKYWKRFEVLPSAPIDHAFHATTPAQPSRSFLARLSKEYRVLSSSLPGMPR